MLVLGPVGGMLSLSGAWAQAADAYGLQVSTSSSRSSAATLAGQTYAASASIFVFTSPADSYVKEVRFYLDNPSRTGTSRRIEGTAPYDFNGSNDGGTAIAYPLSSLSAGTHTITAVVETNGGNLQVLSGTFTISGSTGGSLRFADEFNGSSLDTTKWSAWHAEGHGGNGLRRSSAFSVAGGSLVVTAKMVNGVIVSGGMSHRSDYTYGRYEFRVRTGPDPTGTMSGVVLTWPKYQRSPDFTENDMYETGPSAARNEFDTFIHYSPVTTTQKLFRHYVDVTQWHTIVMDWRPNSLKIYRDGALVWTLTDAVAIPDVLHHLCIQLDARRSDQALTQNVQMFVDYVRIYTLPSEGTD